MNALTPDATLGRQSLSLSTPRDDPDFGLEGEFDFTTSDGRLAAAAAYLFDIHDYTRHHRGVHSFALHRWLRETPRGFTACAGGWLAIAPEFRRHGLSLALASEPSSDSGAEYVPIYVRNHRPHFCFAALQAFFLFPQDQVHRRIIEYFFAPAAYPLAGQATTAADVAGRIEAWLVDRTLYPYPRFV